MMKRQKMKRTKKKKISYHMVIGAVDEETSTSSGRMAISSILRY
jgi:hypothetical protein